MCETQSHYSGTSNPTQSLVSNAVRLKTKLSARDLKTPTMVLKLPIAALLNSGYLESTNLGADYGQESSR
jgi:hypothetical protein